MTTLFRTGFLTKFSGTVVLCLASWLFSPALFGQGAYVPMDAQQLDQLVAPIALYPDSLVAQVLTASTYPQQVSDADNWIHQNAGMPPDQMGPAVNAMPWDPSVKALTAFPSVLDNMARNYNWTAQLGNVYYNQPGDVMNAVQAMRYQAQQAGTLRTTPQERVYTDNGQIQIVPINPAVVYVPYYNPWRVYGAPIPVYAGFYVPPPPPGIVVGLGIGFGPAISVGVFGRFPWGFAAWEPNWHGGVVVYNHATYISRSVTVVNHGNFGAYNREVFERAGPGVPGGFHPTVTRTSAAFARPGGFTRPAPEFNRPTPARPAPEARPGGQFAGRPANEPPRQNPAARPGAPAARPGEYNRAPQAQARPEPARGAAAPNANRGAAPRSEGGGRPQARPQENRGKGEEHERP